MDYVFSWVILVKCGRVMCLESLSRLQHFDTLGHLEAMIEQKVPKMGQKFE